MRAIVWGNCNVARCSGPLWRREDENVSLSYGNQDRKVFENFGWWTRVDCRARAGLGRSVGRKSWAWSPGQPERTKAAWTWTSRWNTAIPCARKINRKNTVSHSIFSFSQEVEVRTARRFRLREHCRLRAKKRLGLDWPLPLFLFNTDSKINALIPCTRLVISWLRWDSI